MLRVRNHVLGDDVDFIFVFIAEHFLLEVVLLTVVIWELAQGETSK